MPWDKKWSILIRKYKRVINIMTEYYNVSSIRMARFLYSLGFDKESYKDKNGKERWRFKKTDDLELSVKFYKSMREKIYRSSTYGKT